MMIELVLGALETTDRSKNAVGVTTASAGCRFFSVPKTLAVRVASNSQSVKGGVYESNIDDLIIPLDVPLERHNPP